MKKENGMFREKVKKNRIHIFRYVCNKALPKLVEGNKNINKIEIGILTFANLLLFIITNHYIYKIQ